jgi:alpha-mannosidase
LEDASSGELLLGGPSNDLISYKDSGGLWRMGYEFAGGIWSQRDRASKERVEFEALERNGGLEISWLSVLDGAEIRRAVWVQVDSPIIHFRLQGRAPKRRTVTASFSTDIVADRFLMDTPGGVVSRPNEKGYSPTFWPFQHFLHVRDSDSGRGLALYQKLPGAASFASDGTLQVIALRNAPRERAYHILPLSGNPAKGYERDEFAFVYALEFTRRGDWVENKLGQKAYARAVNPWADPADTCLRRMAEGQIHTNRPDVRIRANKPASRGRGRIVRLYTLTAPHQEVTLRSAQHEIREAFLCDARERDIGPLEVHDGIAQVPLRGTITTVRLISTLQQPAHQDSGRRVRT